jgi:hypothetical protein
MNGTHPDDTKSISKRKATEDSNPLVKAAKRAKRDVRAVHLNFARFHLFESGLSS